MPKIIKNLESRLAEEARKQIAESGYSAVTIRSVATACGVGVGTVYNYFPSKEVLVASYLLSDWNEGVAEIAAVSNSSERNEPVVRRMYDQLRAYAARHSSVFHDKTAAASMIGSFGRYHSILRSQLASYLLKFCDSDFAAEFIAEAVLVWTMEGREFDEIYGELRKLFVI